MKKYFTILAVLLFAHATMAQDYGGFVFGVKGGLSVGLQKWGNFERDPLYASHGIAFIESLAAEGKFAVFSQIGYHTRGSAIRTRGFTGVDPVSGMDRFYSPRTTKFEFKNISIALGGKQKFPLGENSKLYYLLGFRGEYTVKNNLRDFSDLNGGNGGSFYFPVDEFGWVRKWNYGMIAGGGIEFHLADLYGILIELTVNPDFSNQYNQPPLEGTRNPFTGNIQTIQERTIKNTTIELSVGFRFVRKVEYID